jgi:hypothetical protein
MQRLAADGSLASTLVGFDQIDRQHSEWPGARMLEAGDPAGHQNHEPEQA